jgi:SHS2 domain-containing protein
MSADVLRAGQQGNDFSHLLYEWVSRLLVASTIEQAVYSRLVCPIQKLVALIFYLTSIRDCGN